MTEMSALEDVTRLAIDGDKGTLDLVVRELQAHVYALALRMSHQRESVILTP